MGHRDRTKLGAVATGLALVLLAAAPSAHADHTDDPERVTLMGSLMSELGCETDWDESCDATDLQPTGEGDVWHLAAEVPAGSYEFKVRLNGSWEENYGAGGQADGPNIPLALLEPAELTFSYDHVSHRVAVAPVDPSEPLGPDDEALAGDSLRTDLTRERFYFVMADRFANADPSNDTGGYEVPPDTPADEERLVHGYDPTATGFYHGGDLEGIIDQLDYIEGLGTTSIWLTPSFQNKPVQGAPGQESAGYHGYWITDFTQIDPHLGTNDDMVALVEAAHDRGIKVFFDIITNHTADVITYDESEYDPSGGLPYVSTSDEPYRDATGNPFDDRDYADGSQPFPAVNLDSFPYRPIVPDGEQDVKVPAWLNDPTYYHNRGTSTFSGESNTYGDFPSGAYSSLDDLWTEHPDVLDGMVEIYQTWVREVGIDGFRIDTVKHVNTEFWSQFAPALTGYAATLGNDDFFMFGEVYDANPAFVSHYTTEGGLQAAADFGFQGAATAFVRGAGTTGLRDFFASDDWYTDDDSNVYSLPTFLGNHDMGRIGSFLRQNDEGWTDEQLLQRGMLAHSLMYLVRGQPVVYYGDEQGFSAPPDVPGGIGDQRAREDMFASEVDLYNGYDLIGTDATTAEANFDAGHPLYEHIAALAELREDHPALADGAQTHRYASADPGVYAFSRLDADTGREYVVAVNNATTEQTASFDTFSPRGAFLPIWPNRGRATPTDDEGRIIVTVPALSTTVWRASRPIPDDKTTPMPYFSTPSPGGIVGDERAEVAVSVPGDSFTEVSIAWRPVGTEDWTLLGTDDNAPYRMFHDVSGMATGMMLEYRAVADDADGDLGVAQTYAFVGTQPSDPGGPGGGGPVTQPESVSVPGSFNEEVGCAGDWQPDCALIDLTLDENDLVWKATFEDGNAIPAGSYAYKVAINDSWDENYGLGAVRDGPNIPLDSTGDSITFYYSHATNWVTDSNATPHLFTAPGSFQSELGCSADWDPSCMRSWLQDPDGDGVWTLVTTQLPAGSYEAKAAQDLTWDVNWGAGGVPGGDNIPFVVGEGQGALFSFDEATKVLTVSAFDVEEPDSGPDLSTADAVLLQPDLVAWDLPAERTGWTYRLYVGPEGAFALDAEAITGGTSFPLELSPDGLTAELVDQYPDLADHEALLLSRKDSKQVSKLLPGDIAVAAFDDLGRLVDATSVKLP